MRNRIYPRSLFVLRKANNFWAKIYTFILIVIIIILVPSEGQSSRGDMFRKDNVASAEVTVQSNAVSFKQVSNSSSSNLAAEKNGSNSKPNLKESKAPFNKKKLKEATATPRIATSGTLIPFISTLATSSPSTKKSFFDGYVSPLPPYTIMPTRKPGKDKKTTTTGMMEIRDSDSQESSFEASSVPPHDEDSMQPKSVVPSLLFLTTLGTMGTSTVSTLHYHHTPSSTIITSKKTSTTRRPVRISTSKRPKVPRPATPVPGNYTGKPKRRPKPGRKTTTTTTPEPEEYDYYVDSGEATKSNNNNTTTDSTNSTTKSPLSKLAVAMISTSTGFENNTGSNGELFYPQTPVNLLNILQAYTKQIQMTNSATSGADNPIVNIPNTNVRLNINQLNFAAKLGISLYYSVIAIIPLIYLAFGGVGRLGLLNALTGRSANRRRRKRSNNDDLFYVKPYNKGDVSSHSSESIQRAEIDNDDEYAWILARISQILLDVSLFSDDEE